MLALAATACGDDAPTRASHPNDEEAQSRAVTADPASPPPSTPVDTGATTSAAPVEQAGNPVTLRIGTGGATLLPIDQNNTRVTVTLGGDPTVRGAGIYSGTCGGEANQTALLVPLDPIRQGRSDTEAERALADITSGQHVLVIHRSQNRESAVFECAAIPSGGGQG